MILFSNFFFDIFQILLNLLFKILQSIDFDYQIGNDDAILNDMDDDVLLAAASQADRHFSMFKLFKTNTNLNFFHANSSTVE